MIGKLARDLPIGTKIPLLTGFLVTVTIVVMLIANSMLSSLILSRNAEARLGGISALKHERVSVLLDTID